MDTRLRTRRDLLGNLFFAVHVAVLLVVLAGWTVPARGWLIFYLVFLPALALHWKLNGGQCALNNMESWLRYRAWRAPERNVEEGAWLRLMIARSTGYLFGKAEMDVVLHTGLALLWMIALAHLIV